MTTSTASTARLRITQPAGIRRSSNGMAYLAAMLEHTRDDMRRADTTAGLQIVAVAGLAALVGQVGAALPRLVLVIAAAAAIPAAATLWAAMRVLWPRSLRQDQPVPGSWVHVLHAGPAARAAYAAVDLGTLQLGQLAMLAPIANSKFEHVRHGWRALLATLAVLLAALVSGYLITLI